ncbi:MAG: lamin tail domain-containing protein [Agathobacter sp.]
MKNFKRVLSLALAALMVIGGLVIAPVDAKAASASDVIINEVYGGGGNSNATYTNDYVVLYNKGNEDVSLSGWSIQYRNATSTNAFSGIVNLGGTIQAGKYYVIKLAAGTSVKDKPFPTTTIVNAENTSVNLGGTNATVLLAKTQTAISDVTDENVVDLVGIGTANVWEGSGKAPAFSSQKSVIREKDANGIPVDTNNNNADFITTTPDLTIYNNKTSANPIPEYGTSAEVLDAAIALGNGDTLGSQTVEGKVTQIKEAFNGYYGNVTVEIKVDGYEDYPITCNRLKDGAINSILVGDTIKVKGTVNKDAEGDLSMANGCQLITYTPATGHTAVPDLTDPTPEQIVNAAYALQAGQSLKEDWAVDAVIVGEITSSDSKYTFNIQVGELTEKLILVYELKNAKSGVDISTFKAGDTINISGTWTNYVNESGAETIAITGGYANSHTPKNTGSGEGGSGSGEGGSGEGEGGSGSATTITIDDALAATTGTECTVKGVVTMIEGKNVFIQDATGAICIYLKDALEEGALKLGDTIEAQGEKDAYKGLPELKNATYTKSSGMTLSAKETTIGALTTSDICKYVKLTGLEVLEIDDNNAQYSAPNIKVTDGTNEIQIYKAVVNKNGNEWAIKVGDKINVLAAVGVNNSTLQLRTTNAEEITVVTGGIDNTGDVDTTAVVFIIFAGITLVGLSVLGKKKFA